MHTCSKRARARVGASLLAALIAGVWAPAAAAYVIQCRWVERIGTADIVLGPTVAYLPGTSHRLRVQFGAFDDAEGPAPVGGLLAWNAGTLSTTSGINTRTPGALPPFLFSFHPHGQPAGDPFTSLTGIDAARGHHSVPWLCNPDGSIPPMPDQPVILGRNTFVSVFEITTIVNGPNHLEAAGNNVVGNRWERQSFLEPDCGDPADPSDDVAGFVEFAPHPISPVPFDGCTLDIVPIPGPGGAACSALALAGAGAWRRRRRT